jgi:predicted outer membrane protein
MRQPNHVLSLAVLVLGAAACAGPDGAAQPAAVSGITTTTAGTTSSIPSESATQTPPAPAARPEGKLTDSEIVSIVESAGVSERQQARSALKRAQGERVRQLARLILTDRGQGQLERVEMMTMLVPVDNPTSALLRSNALRVGEGLASTSNADFDAAYVAALAGEERQFIELLGDELIPQAQNGDLRGVLEGLRTSTSSHLGMAQDILSSMAR